MQSHSKRKEILSLPSIRRVWHTRGPKILKQFIMLISGEPPVRHSKGGAPSECLSSSLVLHKTDIFNTQQPTI